MAGTLKAKVNGIWTPIVGTTQPLPPLDEVFVGLTPPRDPATEIWYDTRTDPPILKFKLPDGTWDTFEEGLNEVAVGNTDPYVTDPQSKDELWVDTSGGAPGILKARVGGQWQELIRYGNTAAYEQQYGQQPFGGTLDIAARTDHSHGTPAEEVVIGATDPSTTKPNTDVWYDTSTDPSTLKFRLHSTDEWETLSIPPDDPPMDEVWIGSAPPDPVIGTYEIWIDTSLVPAVLKHEAPVGSGAWFPLMEAEVHVGVEDPYVTNPTSRAELWHDTSIGQAGKLKARYGGQWHPVAEFTESEVEIGPTDPVAAGIPAGSTELWVDSSTTPIILKAWINGAWQEVAGPQSLPAPQEVEIGPAEPRETTVELWYDTTNSPKGTLFANNNSVWEAIVGANAGDGRQHRPVHHRSRLHG